VVNISYYPLGAQVMTLVLPLGWFIVVMIAMYFVFTRPHTVPGHQPIRGARPVAPAAGAAAPAAAATGFPTATSAAGTEPLADRDTPPAVGARSGESTSEDAPQVASDEAAFGGGENNASTETPDSGKPEGTE
jgi:type IV secretory pathway TrbL component